MGTSESKHSTRSDALPNLQYALNELMLWRERGFEEKCTDEKGPGRVFGKPPDASSSSSDTSSSSGAAAAAKPTHDTAMGMTRDSAATSSSSSSDDTSTSGDMMTADVSGSAAAAVSSLHRAHEDATGHDMNQASIMAADRADGEVIRDKYHFILHHIQKLVHAGEENYMMYCKDGWIKNQTSKINLAQAMGPTTRAELERKMNENSTELMKGLGDFDNARMAIQWLLRHFDLLVQRRSLGREICVINVRIANIQKMDPSEDTLDELRHLRARLNAAHAGVGQAVRMAQQLRRESLAVGLQYLDTNHSGSIEPEDQPDLSSQLFSRLDVRNKHRITPNDLQVAVEKMEKSIDTMNKSIVETERDVERIVEEREKLLSGVPGEVETEKRRVQAEELSIEMKKKQESIVRMQKDKEQEEELLRSTYTMFQNAFVESLFDKLGAGRSDDRHRYEALSSDMDNIERNIKHLHIAADQGVKGLASSKLAAASSSPGKKSFSPLLLGRRRGMSQAAGDSSSSSSSSSLSSSLFGSSRSKPSASSFGSNTSSGMTKDSSMAGSDSNMASAPGGINTRNIDSSSNTSSSLIKDRDVEGDKTKATSGGNDNSSNDSSAGGNNDSNPPTSNEQMAALKSKSSQQSQQQQQSQQAQHKRGQSIDDSAI